MLSPAINEIGNCRTDGVPNCIENRKSVSKDSFSGILQVFIFEESNIRGLKEQTDPGESREEA